MALRLGPGPVFFWECVTASRRWQTYALRCAVIGILLVTLTIVWAFKGARDRAQIRDLAEIGAAFFTALISTQMTLILLAAPAATAGAICIDKARGTLLFIFT